MKLKALLVAALCLLALPAYAQRLELLPSGGSLSPNDLVAATRNGSTYGVTAMPIGSTSYGLAPPTYTYPSSYVLTVAGWAAPSGSSSGVSSFNTRTGGITLNAADVGSVVSVSPVTHQFLTGLNSAGAWTQAQPAFSDLSGAATGAQLPAPTTSTFGGILALASGTAHQVVQYVNASGQQVLAQLGFSDLTGTVSAAQLGTSFGNGQLLIGSTGTGLLSAGTLTAGSNVTITNGAGAITIAAASSPVSSFNSRTGAITPASGDYTVSQVTGAAPLASPTFTGTVTGGTFAGTHTGTGSGLSGITISQISGGAPLASPTFTGTVTVPSITINGGNGLGYGVGANSIAVGSSGNLVNLTGAMNTVIGDNIMTGATSALGNTCGGFQSCKNMVGGQNNSAWGLDALLSAVTTTVNDSAVGVYALVNDVGAGGNSAVGYTALGSNSTGFENTAIGESACGSVTSGHDNTCLGIWTGYGAGQIVGSGSSNVLIGSMSQFGSVQPVTVVNSNQSNFLNISNAISADMQTVGRPYFGLGLGSTTIPVYDISLNGAHGSTIAPQLPNGTTSAAGGAVSIQGGAGIGTNQPGGALTLSSGQATGTAGSAVFIKTYTPVASGSSAATLLASVNIDSYGDLFVGDATNSQAAPALSSGGIYPVFLVSGIDAKTSSGIVSRYSADANPPTWAMSKSRGTTRGSLTAVVTGDNTGQILADGYSGANYLDTGKIVFAAEGTVSTTAVPGNITLQTANASGTLTNAVRINSSQQVGIGTNNPLYPLTVIGTTSATSFYAGSTAGVTCSGTPTASFATVNGIVTHC